MKNTVHVIFKTHFDTLPALRGGVHFNLHNNLYNTNFPLWYSDDAAFRFNLEFA